MSMDTFVTYAVFLSGPIVISHIIKTDLYIPMRKDHSQSFELSVEDLRDPMQKISEHILNCIGTKEGASANENA
jgi:hypothetical protein